MIANRRGLSLIEMIFVIGLGAVVLAVGYRMYASVQRADQFDSRRHQIALTSQNLITRIKQDVRSAKAATASGSLLVLDSGSRRIVYRDQSQGVERQVGRGRAKYPGLRAEFTAKQGGVIVRVWSDVKVNRRPVKIDVTTFVHARG